MTPLRIFNRLRRAPDFLIGADNPDGAYMRRWYIIPRNRFFNVYLHHIARSDDDRALHDHPWVNCSIVLRGGYKEIVPADRARPADGNTITLWRGAGSIVFRRATSAHRLEVIEGEPPCWTLFITGPVIREWGFWCPKKFVSHEEFSKPNAPGEIGRGCGEAQ